MTAKGAGRRCPGSLPLYPSSLEGSMDQHTDRHPHRRRQHHGQQRPPAAAGLPADGEAGGAAGEGKEAQ